MSTAGAAPLLEVRGLRVRYRPSAGGDGRAAVADVSFSIAPGESVGLVGESGSGKTSIARALFGLIPAQGQVLFEGRDLFALPARELRATRTQVQIVFQDPFGQLDPRMTVAELVAEPLREFRASARAEERARVLAMLGQVGLGAELLTRFPHQLSGGQAQRVGLARALMLEPRLLVCDEPMAALDASVKSQIANLLRDLRDRMRLALLFIAHDLTTVRYLCDRVMVMYLGQVMEMASRAALYGAPRHPYTRALLAASPVPDPARSRPSAPIGGEIPRYGDAEAGCVFRHRCPLAIARCAQERPALRTVGESLVACHRAEE